MERGYDYPELRREDMRRRINADIRAFETMVKQLTAGADALAKAFLEFGRVLAKSEIPEKFKKKG